MLKQCVKFKFYVLIHSITYAQLQPYYFLFCLFCFICLTMRYKEQDLSVVCIGIDASYLLDPNYILIIILLLTCVFLLKVSIRLAAEIFIQSDNLYLQNVI